MCAPTKNQILCPLPPPHNKKKFLSHPRGSPLFAIFCFLGFFFVSDLTKTQKSQYKLLLSEVNFLAVFFREYEKKSGSNSGTNKL